MKLCWIQFRYDYNVSQKYQNIFGLWSLMCELGQISRFFPFIKSFILISESWPANYADCFLFRLKLWLRFHFLFIRVLLKLRASAVLVCRLVFFIVGELDWTSYWFGGFWCLVAQLAGISAYVLDYGISPVCWMMFLQVCVCLLELAPFFVAEAALEDMVDAGGGA